MALTATIHKTELTVSDLDRDYYATHNLTVALHPSETESRMMLRLMAFALNAHQDLSFTWGLSSTEEPDLWRHNPDGTLEEWIELGQPDEKRLRKACGQARSVTVYTYGKQAPWHGGTVWAENLAVLTICEYGESCRKARPALPLWHGVKCGLMP